MIQPIGASEPERKGPGSVGAFGFLPGSVCAAMVDLRRRVRRASPPGAEPDCHASRGRLACAQAKAAATPNTRCATKVIQPRACTNHGKSSVPPCIVTT